jgi:hypothetical protein
MISTTYVKSCFGSCHIYQGSRHVYPQSAWVFGVPCCLTIEYESGKWTPQVRGHVPGAIPRSGFGTGEVSHYPVAKRTQGLDNLYERRHPSIKALRLVGTFPRDITRESPNATPPELRVQNQCRVCELPPWVVSRGRESGALSKNDESPACLADPWSAPVDSANGNPGPDARERQALQRVGV